MILSTSFLTTNKYTYYQRDLKELSEDERKANFKKGTTEDNTDTLAGNKSRLEIEKDLPTSKTEQRQFEGINAELFFLRRNLIILLKGFL